MHDFDVTIRRKYTPPRGFTLLAELEDGTPIGEPVWIEMDEHLRFSIPKVCEAVDTFIDLALLT